MANVYNKPIVVVGGGGGGATVPVDHGPIYEGKYRVRYFDIDGTVLKIEYVADGGTITPPPAPEYDPDYLIFDEWNYDAATYIVEQPTDVGASYKTVDDTTYMFITLTSRIGLSLDLQNISGFISIDWGDGTIDTNTSHTYTNYGNYIIKISGDVECSGVPFNDQTKQNALTKIYIKKGVQTFNLFYSVNVKLISVPATLNIVTNNFSSCRSLKFVILPRSSNLSNNYIFNGCDSLKQAILGQNTTIIKSMTFTSSPRIETINIPPSVVLVQQSWGNNNAIKSLILGKSVQKIESVFCQYPQTIEEIIICCNQVPTLTATFSNFNPLCIIWVKDSLVEELKIATNWSTYAGIIKPLSWYPSLTDPNT